jgi:hypothetical protein
MKVFYTISLFLFLSVGFAQNSKLKGIWVEYKREVIGDTSSKFSFNNRGIYPDIDYVFRKDSGYYINGEDENCNLFILKNDSLTLHYTINPRAHYGQKKVVYIKPIRFLDKKTMIIDDIGDSTKLRYRHYFKKRKKYTTEFFDPGLYCFSQCRIDFPGDNDSLNKFAFSEQGYETYNKNLKVENVEMEIYMNEDGSIFNAIIIGNPSKSSALKAMRVLEKWKNFIPNQSSAFKSFDGTKYEATLNNCHQPFSIPIVIE